MRARGQNENSHSFEHQRVDTPFFSEIRMVARRPRCVPGILGGLPTYPLLGTLPRAPREIPSCTIINVIFFSREKSWGFPFSDIEEGSKDAGWGFVAFFSSSFFPLLFFLFFFSSSFFPLLFFLFFFSPAAYSTLSSVHGERKKCQGWEEWFCSFCLCGKMNFF